MSHPRETPRQLQLMLMAALAPDLHAQGVLNATREHDNWCESLADAVARAREIHEEKYHCGCGSPSCKAETPEYRAVEVFRVDVDEPDNGVREYFADSQIADSIGAWHGYAVANVDTMGWWGISIMNGAKLVARVPADPEAFVQYDNFDEE